MGGKKKYPQVRGYRVPPELHDRLTEWRRTEQSKQGAPMSESAAVFELLERGLQSRQSPVAVVDLTGKMLAVIVEPFRYTCVPGTPIVDGGPDNDNARFRLHDLVRVPLTEGVDRLMVGGNLGEQIGGDESRIFVRERRKCRNCDGEVWVIEHVNLRRFGELRGSLLDGN